ncbi:NADH-quinone oxidoreductase subunit J [Alicyclobacillus sp. TC]|uniref:NADH-quinone oxidoreductase subunit J n=2 Tax=Alicyclobacillus tolerans TaxID=90970 RepID=A0ABT9LU10_9BACL|nr:MULTISPECIES: NADH-quinone oxidoreductase subunit J [Alicyclobacillus]MDP9727748.1 NADH:ubiquinone oxidoreductase subunit 6 (subunit J) [Alicyclobacillus tengchongensis]QRF24432.1 NADH-quinone oxidoreductase subunit J [Alicyclobacillus sp. TC]SHK54705.1 NADH-quinone oxidoreductase subunit J [Alicyclobacillus montanus]
MVHFFSHGDSLAFYVLALIILLSAMLFLQFRKVIYMALAMGAIFVGCAALFLLLGAVFVGIAQVMIYAGAITILMMFAIMLTNHEATESVSAFGIRKGLAALGAFLLAVILLFTIRATHWRQSLVVNTDTQHNVDKIGFMLFRQYTIPFELVSLLLLAALVGAVWIARQTKEEKQD